MTETPTIADFPIRTHDKLRYSDTDKQGHVNNAVYSTFYETGRVEFIDGARKANAGSQAEFVIAKLTISFSAEIHWPGEVHVGSRVKRIGNSSLVIEQAVFNNDRLCSTGESVVVQINSETRTAQPFNADERAYFESLLAD